ncbi:MAG: diacylglycerol O-acyltransferase / wax synthase [Solirubrobacteraceae bacterium]|jgi:WS/DGAT/MGAT family acyltransferase|nr:diacylglycerol O-acyltransferase / wax synthase [Solirubrobacteraceae bacterium]
MPSPDQPLNWGATRDLDPFETLMWRAEADPHMRSTIMGIEILDRAPDWDRLHSAHEWASRMVPRFRRKVVDPGIAPPKWVADANLELDYHLRRVALPEGSSFDDLLKACSTLAMTPFDRNRPPWEAVLFENLPDGRAAYALKLHHVTTDGMGITQLLGGLHRPTRDGDPNRPEPDAPDAESYSLFAALADQARDDLKGAAGLVAKPLGALTHPRSALKDSVAFAGSLRRVAGGPGVPGSPLLANRSTMWRFLALDLKFKDLRGASKAHGCTLNDAFLAALLGGFRIYHEELGEPLEHLPLSFPINIRKEGDADGGNRIGAARIAGPTGIVDAVERMQAVSALAKAARGEPAMEALTMIAPMMSRLPPRVIGKLAGQMTGSSDLQASNVPGITEERFLAGARVDQIFGYAPLPGVAAMITLASHLDLCCIGANVDPAAVTEPERFARCLKDGFDEVLACNPGGGSATVRA